MSSFATNSQPIKESYLYGSWKCKGEMVHKKTNMTFNFNYKVNFENNGQANGFGSVLLSFSEFTNLKYSLLDNSTWEIKNGRLIYSSIYIKLKNISHPNLDSIVNLEKLMPQHIEETSKIIRLTKSELEVQPKKNGRKYVCLKITTES